MSNKDCLADRFWQKVAVAPDAESCWLWAGTKTKGGYGVIANDRKRQYAHRVSYQINVGPIPPTSVIDHKCHNPACVNPNHLQAVSQKQNCENLGAIRADNKTGIRGVGLDNRRGMFRARVHHFHKEIHVGYFATAEEAGSAAAAKRNELFTNNLLDRANA